MHLEYWKTDGRHQRAKGLRRLETQSFFSYLWTVANFDWPINEIDKWILNFIDARQGEVNELLEWSDLAIEQSE